MYATQQNSVNNNPNRYNQQPPNPYQSKSNSGYNQQQQQQQQQYGQYHKQNHQQPPSVGFGIDDNPYDMEQMAMYQQNPDSEDSSNGNNNDEHSNNDNAQIDIGSYRSNVSPLNMSMGNNNNNNNEILPKMPVIPPMVQINDVNLKPEEEELRRHVGFVIKLNSRLVHLNAECRLLYPKLSSDLVDSKISEFQDIEYKKLIENKVLLEKKCNEYEQQIQMLLPVQNLNNDLNSEINKLRNNDSNEYMIELQKQLDIYRDKVIYLSKSVQNCMIAIKNSVLHTKTTQENISDAYNELKPLQEHLTFLEENMNMNSNKGIENKLNELNIEMDKIKTENKLNIEQMEFKNNALQNELNILKQQQKTVASEKIANKAQIEEHIEYKYKAKMQALNERLSNMTIKLITMEDDFTQRQKQEQERADKYRAKYESVKQHVKTLEMQKVEYTRVNMQLRQQNNDFRSMITQLQNQLKSVVNNNNAPPQINNQQNELQKLQQQQQLMMNEQQSIMKQHQQQNQNQNQNQKINHQHANTYMNNIHQPQIQNNNHQYSNSINNPPPPNIQQQQQQQQYNINNNNNLGIDPNQMLMGNQPLNESVRNVIPQAHRELWGKRTKVISEKATKKRILVEWHFVTSDNQPHTVVLQHTQDTKPKTRRMLWVDGSEKYNNKSSASSFRIEIDKDVVVVSIDQLDQYQYRLTINNASYADAFKLWEQRQQQR